MHTIFLIFHASHVVRYHVDRYSLKESFAMPAIDQCEEQVVRALEKSGWLVTHQPFAIRINKSRAGYVYADLRLRQKTDNQTIIVVEVKCFASTRTQLDEFYQAVGQYVSYRNALTINGMQLPVYLSVPSSVYTTFFQIPLIAAVVADIQIKLVVIDLEKEEITQWIS